jgi:hypothetical protein
MEIPISKLQLSAPKCPDAAPRVEPALGLGEELVLLSVDVGKHRVSAFVDLAHEAYGEPRGYAEAVAALEALELVTRSGLMHRLATTESAKVPERRRHVLHAVRSTGDLTDADADLLVGLAAATELKLHSGDRLRARHHLTSLGHKRPLTRFVELVAEQLHAESMSALAEKLLPPELSFEGSFDSGVNQGAWMYAAIVGTGF